MHPIALQIYKFLEDIKDKPYKIPKDLLIKFGYETRAALQKQFEREPRDFHISMSNIGRPLCQLQYELAGHKGENSNNVVRNLFGDLIEDLVLFLLHASGIKVVSELQRVSVEIEGLRINGEYDVILDTGNGPEVWDIKSASDWAFRNKFREGITFNEFRKDDLFGYTSQLVLYGEGAGVPIGGFIVGSKSSGEIRIISIPESERGEIRRAELEQIHDTAKKLSSIPKSDGVVHPERVFTAHGELFNSKPTGNLLLPEQCNFCAHKWVCWPTLQIRPQAKSKAKNKKMLYYTEYYEDE